jgi:integrase
MKRIEIPEGLTWKLFIRKPGKDRRKNYRIVRRHHDGKWETIKDSRIDSINQSNLSQDEIIKQLELVIEDIYRKHGAIVLKAVSNKHNQKLLDKFWESEYTHRNLVDPGTMYHDFARAIDALGESSLSSATQTDIQRCIDTRANGDSDKQRRLVSRMITLLRYINRHDVKLRKMKPARPRVKYLTPSEFKAVLVSLADIQVKSLVEMAFHSGCRVGELFALESYHWKGNGELEVEAQVDLKGETRDTKTRTRRTTLFTGDKEVFDRWLKVKGEVNPKKRGSAATTFRQACIEVFDDKQKWLNIHDLRHSYAIYLAQNGVSIGLIAGCLGNSEIVCERYYKGFSLTSESIQTVRMILEKNKAG